jgi:hypothetical protein
MDLRSVIDSAAFFLHYDADLVRASVFAISRSRPVSEHLLTAGTRNLPLLVISASHGRCSAIGVVTQNQWTVFKS